MKKIPLSMFFLLMVGPVLLAGNYKISSEVDSVKAPGYYKIQLNHDIISYAETNYADIRLVNSRGEEIPFIFREEKPLTSTTGFKDYIILENEYIEKKKQSRLVIHNGNKNVISELVLIIRNSNIKKEVTLKGSDNRKNWFIIWKGYPQSVGNFNETAGKFTIGFPKSDYEYFELSTNNKYNDPIQITRVGYLDPDITEGIYSELPVKKISQKDSSNKKSYIYIEFPRPYEFGKLHLDVTGAELFKRNVILAHPITQNNKAVQEFLESFELSSTQPAIWQTPKLKFEKLVLVIENLDNKPLRVEKVKFYQLNKYIIAKLEKGEKYYVKSGNKNVSVPRYDLEYFSNSIPDALPTLQVKQMSIAKDDTSEPGIFFTKTFLWVVISVIILLLGYFSIRLLKEMK